MTENYDFLTFFGLGAKYTRQNIVKRRLIEIPGGIIFYVWKTRSRAKSSTSL
jgi:hypothetical protein